MPPRPPTSPEPGQSRPLESAGPGRERVSHSPGAAGRGCGGAGWPRPFTPTRRDPPDKHPGVAAAGPSHGGPRSPPAMPNPLPAAAQFSGEKTEAQRVSHGRRVAQSAGGGGRGVLCTRPAGLGTRVRAYWRRPLPHSKHGLGTHDCWGRASGGGRLRRRTGRGDGVAQADCKEQGAPGGLYPGNKQPRGALPGV